MVVKLFIFGSVVPLMAPKINNLKKPYIMKKIIIVSVVILSSIVACAQTPSTHLKRELIQESSPLGDRSKENELQSNSGFLSMRPQKITTNAQQRNAKYGHKIVLLIDDKYQLFEPTHIIVVRSTRMMLTAKEASVDYPVQPKISDSILGLSNIQIEMYFLPHKEKIYTQENYDGLRPYNGPQHRNDCYCSYCYSSRNRKKGPIYPFSR